MIYTLGNMRLETCGDEYYIAPGAQVIGEVRLGREASVWFNCVLRGDNALLSVGEGSNVQDGAVIHTDAGVPVHVGRDVTIGHMVLLHGCTVDDDSMIANGAMILDGAHIGKFCIVAAGALVPPNRHIPDGSVVMGSPGRIVREATESDLALIKAGSEHYRARGRLYRESLAIDLRSESIMSPHV